MGGTCRESSSLTSARAYDNLLVSSAVHLPEASLLTDSNVVCTVLILQPRCDPVPCPEFAGPPGICVCANGYDGIPDWDDTNNVWLHECVRDHLDNVTNPVCMPLLSCHAHLSVPCA